MATGFPRAMLAFPTTNTSSSVVHMKKRTVLWSFCWFDQVPWQRRKSIRLLIYVPKHVRDRFGTEIECNNSLLKYGLHCKL